jgi:CBS domain-containing protein
MEGSSAESVKEKAMTIGAILSGRTGEVITASRNMSVTDAVAMLSDRKIGAVPVVENDEVVGVFSERDVITCLARDGAAVLGSTVERLMTSPAITVERGTAVLASLSLMTSRRIRHLPVVEEGRLIGIVSIGDLVKFRLERIEAEAEAMRSYIQSA